ncbi:hypothetical protein JQ621_01580 [Bradyrhizobium manausense]|uniref:hypothetical protein n=1 Tax=Bradyrhizobium manausense TaxID=989370 RepID=UPI001BA5F9FD|nr:hypothetical protein [Bradyrhizobium manausense]MBR1086160.1 hypothetical protein [Bradyrhizobium manausense]
MATSYRAGRGAASRTGSKSVYCRFSSQALSDGAGLFRPQGARETKPGAHETISRIGEDVRKLVMVTNPANERRAANWA